jgi:hypothetical protein
MNRRNRDYGLQQQIMKTRRKTRRRKIALLFDSHLMDMLYGLKQAQATYPFDTRFSYACYVQEREVIDELKKRGHKDN